MANLIYKNFLIKKGGLKILLIIINKNKFQIKN